MRREGREPLRLSGVGAHRPEKRRDRAAALQKRTWLQCRPPSNVMIIAVRVPACATSATPWLGVVKPRTVAAPAGTAVEARDQLPAASLASGGEDDAGLWRGEHRPERDGALAAELVRG